MTKVIKTFSGKNRFLSNFFPAPFVWAGVRWKTSEHAYQAAKIDDSSDYEAWLDKIATATTAGDAKRLGKKVPMRKGWDKIKVEIMHRIVRQKFIQNPTLMQRLLDTGDAILQEGNTWHDNFWGMCPPGNPEGKNMLGKVLMEIRTEFKGVENLQGHCDKHLLEQSIKIELEDMPKKRK